MDRNTRNSGQTQKHKEQWTDTERRQTNTITKQNTKKMDNRNLTKRVAIVKRRSVGVERATDIIF